jgi:hypothetical protein
MLCCLRRFLADDAGHLVAQTWMLVGTVLLLGSALSLIAWQRYLDDPLPTARPTPLLRAKSPRPAVGPTSLPPHSSTRKA